MPRISCGLPPVCRHIKWISACPVELVWMHGHIFINKYFNILCPKSILHMRIHIFIYIYSTYVYSSVSFLLPPAISCFWLAFHCLYYIYDFFLLGYERTPNLIVYPNFTVWKDSFMFYVYLFKKYAFNFFLLPKELQVLHRLKAFIAW